MSKIKTSQKNKSVITYAPQVIAMATSAVTRLQKLLTICDYQINALEAKIASLTEGQHKELLTLIRMVLNIEKALDKYAGIVYPSVKQFVTETQDKYEFKHSTPDFETSNETIIDDSLEITHSYPELSGLNPFPSDEAQAGDRRNYDSKAHFDEKFHNIDKKTRKHQKFSHSFFQNRPQKTKSASILI